MTQVAFVSTERQTIRSDIVGWGYEDSDLLVRKALPREPWKIFIGYTPAPKDIPDYGTVMEMLADGWKLLGPPTEAGWVTEDGKKIESWDWWLTREPK